MRSSLSALRAAFLASMYFRSYFGVVGPALAGDLALSLFRIWLAGFSIFCIVRASASSCRHGIRQMGCTLANDIDDDDRCRKVRARGERRPAYGVRSQDNWALESAAL